MTDTSSTQVQPTNSPTAKVMAATTGSAAGTAAATIIVYVLNTYLLAGRPLPNEVQSSITLLVAAGVSFLFGYYKSPSPSETTTVGGNGKPVTGRIVAKTS
jgi:hypothetical protein